MSEFLPITSGCDCVSRVDAPRIHTNGRAVPAPAADAAPADSVELSDHARLLSRIKELPEVRAELVDRARHNIAAGAYEANGALDAAIDAAISDLDLFA